MSRLTTDNIQVPIFNVSKKGVTPSHDNYMVFGYRLDCDEALYGRLKVIETHLGKTTFLQYHTGELFPIIFYVLDTHIVTEMNRVDDELQEELDRIEKSRITPNPDKNNIL